MRESVRPREVVRFRECARGTPQHHTVHAKSMHTERPETVTAFIEAATALLEMPLDAERRVAVAANLRRIASFAKNLGALQLADDIEIAGEFVP